MAEIDNEYNKQIDELLFFFFKQKTAYEIRLSLVGSEMCIRDSYRDYFTSFNNIGIPNKNSSYYIIIVLYNYSFYICLLYTSDAADEQRGVDLGGRRIINKKKNHNFDHAITSRK